MLGIILELFVVKKQLFTRGEHEFCAAIVTLQYSVDEFHDRLPQKQGLRSKSAMNLRPCRSRFPVFERPRNNKGPGRNKRAAITQRASAPRRLNYFAPYETLPSAQLEMSNRDVPSNGLAIWLASPGGR
jgi:hypothetical protein